MQASSFARHPSVKKQQSSTMIFLGRTLPWVSSPRTSVQVIFFGSHLTAVMSDAARVQQTFVQHVGKFHGYAVLGFRVCVLPDPKIWLMNRCYDSERCTVWPNLDATGTHLETG